MNAKALEALKRIEISTFPSNQIIYSVGDMVNDLDTIRLALSAPTFEDAVKIVEEQRQEFMRDVYPEYASLVSVYDALLTALRERGKKE